MVFNILAEIATLPGIGKIPPNSDTKNTTNLFDFTLCSNNLKTSIRYPLSLRIPVMNIINIK
jgi:hypothetical protein